MKSLRLVVAAVMLTGALTQAAPLEKDKDKDKKENPGKNENPGNGADNGKNEEKVTICHFPGHEGDFQITLGTQTCDGRKINVALSAAINGHKIADATVVASKEDDDSADDASDDDTD